MWPQDSSSIDYSRRLVALLCFGRGAFRELMAKLKSRRGCFWRDVCCGHCRVCQQINATLLLSLERLTLALLFRKTEVEISKGVALSRVPDEKGPESGSSLNGQASRFPVGLDSESGKHRGIRTD